MIWSDRIHNSKYQRSTTFGWKDIGIRKSEFVAKTQFVFFQNTFLYKNLATSSGLSLNSFGV